MILKNSFSPLVFSSEKPYSVLDTFSNTTGIKQVSLEQNSHVIYLAVVDESQIDFQIDLLGSSASLEFFGIFVGNVKSQVLTKLLSNSSFAQITIFCVVLDDVDMQVDGNIVLGNDIESSEGHLLEEQFLLGTPKHLLVRPVLDVRSHRVKASHGAKIHTLNKDKLFYMMSKGLSLQEAQKIVVEATLKSLFDRIELKNTDEILKNLLTRIFS